MGESLLPERSFCHFLVCIFDVIQEDEKAVDGGMVPDAKGKDANPEEQTEGSKWQRPRLSRKSLMKCCLVKWIIASTTQQGPGRRTRADSRTLEAFNFFALQNTWILEHLLSIRCVSVPSLPFCLHFHFTNSHFYFCSSSVNERTNLRLLWLWRIILHIEFSLQSFSL